MTDYSTIYSKPSSRNPSIAALRASFVRNKKSSGSAQPSGPSSGQTTPRSRADDRESVVAEYGSVSISQSKSYSVDLVNIPTTGKRNLYFFFRRSDGQFERFYKLAGYFKISSNSLC